MRDPAAEKLEIIRLVEQSPLPVRHTLAKLGIPRATFYRWYERYSRGGPEGRIAERTHQNRCEEDEERGHRAEAEERQPEERRGAE